MLGMFKPTFFFGCVRIAFRRTDQGITFRTRLLSAHILNDPVFFWP